MGGGRDEWERDGGEAKVPGENKGGAGPAGGIDRRVTDDRGAGGEETGRDWQRAGVWRDGGGFETKVGEFHFNFVAATGGV